MEEMKWTFSVASHQSSCFQLTGCPFLVQDMMTAESEGTVAAQKKVWSDPSAYTFEVTSNVSAEK